METESRTASIDRLLADEDEAREAGRAEEELEVAGLGGEDPVALATGGDEHGGDSGGGGWLGGGVEDGDSEEAVVAGGGERRKVGEGEGDEARRYEGFERGLVQCHFSVQN